jgi:hypothetical protein
MRYILPVFPYFYIWCSRIISHISTAKQPRILFVALALLWSVSSSLLIYPHSLSYFNELAGGPSGGHSHLINSNIDWGQDLIYLREWMLDHPEAEPLHLAYYGVVDPAFYGIKYQRFRGFEMPIANENHPDVGWYAIDLNSLHHRSGIYEYFSGIRPEAMAGYSIYIYYITPEEATVIRSGSGLPSLSEEVPVK